jgi:hypothetical protein
MATELAKSFGLADEADLTSVVAEPTGLGAGVPVSESLSGTGRFGVDPAEAAGEKAGLLGRSDAPRTVELEVKKEAFVSAPAGAARSATRGGRSTPTAADGCPSFTHDGTNSGESSGTPQMTTICKV